MLSDQYFSFISNLDINWQIVDSQILFLACKHGKPHPTLSCGQFVGSNKCPAGYSCLGHPADAYFACCPDGMYFCFNWTLTS